jgi:hypothetical protein
LYLKTEKRHTSGIPRFKLARNMIEDYFSTIQLNPYEKFLTHRAIAYQTFTDIQP